MEKRYSLTEILIKEDSLMDSIIESQNCIREAVTQRDWICLERSISKMQEYATDFISLDSEREALGITNFSEEEHLLMKQIQSKLLKSKIVNNALNDYVKISRGFVQNIIENVVPLRKNVLYSENGSLVKPLPQSVVLNKVF